MTWVRDRFNPNEILATSRPEERENHNHLTFVKFCLYPEDDVFSVSKTITQSYSLKEYTYTRVMISIIFNHLRIVGVHKKSELKCPSKGRYKKLMFKQPFLNLTGPHQDRCEEKGEGEEDLLPLHKRLIRPPTFRV